jgi:hypothetical protein
MSRRAVADHRLPRIRIQFITSWFDSISSNSSWRQQKMRQQKMTRTIHSILLAGSAILYMASAQCQQSQDIPSVSATVTSASDLPSVAQLPAGKSTVLGGDIALVDPVRDQLTLNAVGMRPMKILYDERTQVFRNGTKVSVLDLRPSQHASIQTMLDGDKVFAASIHILSNSLESVFQGRVESYHPQTGEITIADALSGEPLKLFVPKDALIARQGQRAFSSAPTGLWDLETGTLVSVSFRSEGQGRGVADHVSILATPGSTFNFDGSISEMDQHAGYFVLVSSQEAQSFRIFLGTVQLTSFANLHPGNQVRVTARYDGTRYVATSLTPR